MNQTDTHANNTSHTNNTSPSLGEDKKNVSYHVKSLFTIIPVKGTIDYIIYQMHGKKKFVPVCTKLIFKRLLLKLATEFKFTFFRKQFLPAN